MSSVHKTNVPDEYVPRGEADGAHLYANGVRHLVAVNLGNPRPNEGVYALCNLPAGNSRKISRGGGGRFRGGVQVATIRSHKKNRLIIHVTDCHWTIGHLPTQPNHTRGRGKEGTPKEMARNYQEPKCSNYDMIRSSERRIVASEERRLLLWPTALNRDFKTRRKKKGDRQKAQLPCSNRPPTAPPTTYTAYGVTKIGVPHRTIFNTIATSIPPTRRFMGGTVVSKG